MKAPALEDRIANVFVERLHTQVPSPSTDFIESGVIDSLMFVELIAHLEQEFSIKIPLNDLDLNHFRSVAGIGEFIRSKLPVSEVSVGTYSRV